MLNPANDDPVTGHEAVADDPPVFALVFEARVGHEILRGVDLLQVDDRDRICRFTVMARPIPALMALSARMSGPRR